MTKEIPVQARITVKTRAHFRCERCGVPAPTGQWHHRRSRSRRDEHTHCPCNGVWLCATCHGWVHAHPLEARAEGGFIVSRHVDQPGAVPVVTPWGVRVHGCDGTYVFRSNDDEGSTP